VRFALACSALVVALVAAPRVASAEEIKEILVQENTKTTTDTVTLIADIDVGDDWSVDMITGIKTRLLSSGLFKDAEVFSSTVPGGVRVTIVVHDKHSWVIAPAFYNQPTNKGAGVGYGENNLFGQNQKLLLYGQIASGDTFFIGAWVIPSIGGTPFYAQLDTYLKQSRVIEYKSPNGYLDSPEAIRESRLNYLNGGIRLGIEPIRGYKLDGRLRGAVVSYSDSPLFGNAKAPSYLGKNPDDQGIDLGSSSATNVQNPGKEGNDVSAEGSFTIDRRANYLGVTTGTKLSVAYEHSLNALGSDFSYSLLSFGYAKGWQVLERHNLNIKGNFQYGRHLPFQQELLLGGTSMRGYVNNQYRGDSRALVNLEYSLPLFSLFGLSVRGLGFWDSGYIAFLNEDSKQRNYLPGSRREDQDKFAGFKNSVGVGTRLYLKQIVLPLLGVDVGYGLEAGDIQVYLAIGLTD
jgi:outer membrane protein assembly factor BamA